MKKRIPLTFVVLSALSINAHAGLVNSSLYYEGDALITLHEETGLEWLKLTETDGMSYNKIVEEISDGGKFEGWRLPSYEEARTYTAEALKVVTGMRFDDTNVTWNGPHINELKALFMTIGTTIGDLNTTSMGVNGLYYDEGGGVKSISAFRTGNDTYNGYARYDYDSFQRKDVSSSSTGFFLVSDGGISLESKLDPEINANNPNAPINNVPTPLIGALGFFALFSMGRQKRKQV